MPVFEIVKIRFCTKICQKFPYFPAHVCVKKVSHQNLPKMSHICRPDLFPRTCMCEKSFTPKFAKNVPNLPAQFIFTHMYVSKKFCTKICQKCPKFAGPIYFHTYVCVKKFRTKICQKCPKFAGPIYFHAHVCREEFLWQFLLISLLRLRGKFCFTIQ